MMTGFAQPAEELAHQGTISYDQLSAQVQRAVDQYTGGNIGSMDLPMPRGTIIIKGKKAYWEDAQGRTLLVERGTVQDREYSTLPSWAQVAINQAIAYNSISTQSRDNATLIVSGIGVNRTITFNGQKIINIPR